MSGAGSLQWTPSGRVWVDLADVMKEGLLKRGYNMNKSSMLTFTWMGAHIKQFDKQGIEHNIHKEAVAFASDVRFALHRGTLLPADTVNYVPIRNIKASIDVFSVFLEEYGELEYIVNSVGKPLGNKIRYSLDIIMAYECILYFYNRDKETWKQEMEKIK